MFIYILLSCKISTNLNTKKGNRMIRLEIFIEFQNSLLVNLLMGLVSLFNASY